MLDVRRGERARGEHCRVPFRSWRKAKGAPAMPGRRSRASSRIDVVKPSFSASVQNMDLPQAMSLKKMRPLKKRANTCGTFVGRRPKRLRISARTRASRHRTLGSQRNGASRNRSGRFSHDLNPEFGRRPIAARPPTPARSSLVAPNPIFEGIEKRGSIDSAVTLPRDPSPSPGRDGDRRDTNRASAQYRSLESAF